MAAVFHRVHSSCYARLIERPRPRRSLSGSDCTTIRYRRQRSARGRGTDLLSRSGSLREPAWLPSRHLGLQSQCAYGGRVDLVPVSNQPSAHLVRDEGVAGSNPATPTKQIP